MAVPMNDAAQAAYKKLQADFARITGLPWSCSKSTTSREFSEQATLEEQQKLFRDIMLLMRFKFDVNDMAITSENLSYLVLSKNGLLKCIQSVIDMDETSQKNTTIDQRCITFGQAIVHIPKTCCPLAEFFDNISLQVFELFTSFPKKFGRTPRTLRMMKIAAAIVGEMIKRHRKYAHQFFIKRVLDSFIPPGNALAIGDAIIVVQGLLHCTFDPEYFLPVFPNLFYIACVLEGSMLQQKTQVFDVLTNLLSRTDHPQYLIDDALFAKHHLSVVYKRTDVIQFNDEAYDVNEELDFLAVDARAQLTVKLINELKSGAKMDVFLLLVDRLTNVHIHRWQQNMLLVAVIDSIQENVSDLITEYPSKAIHFVNAMVKNSCFVSTAKYALRNSSDGDEDQFDEGLEQNAKHSVQFVLHILSILVGESDKVTKLI